MREPSEAIRSYLSRDDLPESVTILDGEELQAFAEKASTESGEPLKRSATVVQFNLRNRIFAAFVLLVSVFGLGMICWYFRHNEAYARNSHTTVIPAVLVAVISGIAFYTILHAYFSNRWLILDEVGARFRVRRFIRYRMENFPFASIEEVAMEIFPTRRGELARLMVVLNANPVELFQGQVEEAENGIIAWTAGLLGAATGMPVTSRKFPSAREILRRPSTDVFP